MSSEWDFGVPGHVADPSDPPPEPTAQPQPPLNLLYAAFGAAVAGGTVGVLFGDSLTMSLLGWVLAGPAGDGRVTADSLEVGPEVRREPVCQRDGVFASAGC